MTRLLTSGVAAVALVAALAPAPASGATYDQLAYLTFNAPVQIPGVTLGAGTYRFHLANPETGRNVLQVLSGDGAIVYAMFHTIPDSRTVLLDEPAVTFRETPSGVPPAVRSLFYGGEYRGYEFVYPEGGPNMFAEEWPQPPVTYMPLTVVPAIEPVAELEVPAVVAAEPVAPEPEQAPAELPRTATPLPMIATGGAGAMLLGLGLRWLRRRSA